MKLEEIIKPCVFAEETTNVKRKMSDDSKIKITENYYVGRLYVTKPVYEITIYNPTDEDKKAYPSVLFDKGNGKNVHLLPRDKVLSISCSKAVGNKRKAIIEKIEDKNKSLIRGAGGEGSRVASGFAKTSAGYSSGENGCKLFQFVPLQAEEVKFDLIFVRFFNEKVEKENIVNCILNCLQLKIYEGNEPVALENYPANGDDDMIYDGKSVYYIFPVDFNESADVIADKLIQFIKEYLDKNRKKN